MRPKRPQRPQLTSRQLLDALYDDFIRLQIPTHLDPFVVSQRIDLLRPRTIILTKHLKALPSLYITDDGEVEARWIIGSTVVDLCVITNSDLEIYVFDREVLEITEDFAIRNGKIERDPSWKRTDQTQSKLPPAEKFI